MGTPIAMVLKDGSAVLEESIWSECSHLWLNKNNDEDFKTPPSLVERAFTPYYTRNIRNKEGNDQYIFQHFNELCIVGLAPSHSVFQQPRALKETGQEEGANERKEGEEKKEEPLRFTTITPNPALKPSAPKKLHGVRPNDPATLLCTIERSDGCSFPVYFGVYGCFVEFNARLFSASSTPALDDLLRNKTTTEGHIAILLPKTKENAPLTTLKYIQTQEQYNASILAGSNTLNGTSSNNDSDHNTTNNDNNDNSDSKQVPMEIH